MSRQFRYVHVGVAALLAAATVTAVGLVQTVGAAGGTASVYVPISPCRLVDTRPGTINIGPRATPIRAAESVTFAVWGTNGKCTIPNTATGIASNVTAVNPTADSYVTIYPADVSPPPTASNLNVVIGGPPTPNQVTVGLSAAGAIAAYNNGGTVDLVVDIVGYYAPAVSTSPTCPTSGCTLVLSGWNSIDADPTSTLDRWGCRVMPQFNNAFMAIDLPLGARITAVSVRYIDVNSDSSHYSLAYITVPGSVSVSASADLSSVDGQLTGSLVFATPPPAVSPTAVPFLSMATISGGTQTFCGITVTYTF